MDEILTAAEPSESADVGNAVSPSDQSPEDERLRLRRLSMKDGSNA
jgi:hypothetical protein